MADDNEERAKGSAEAESKTSGGGQESTAEETPKVVPYEEFDAIRKAQQGSDRAYHQTKEQLEKLSKDFEELQKRSMSDKERQEYESAERQKQLEAKEREVADASLRLTRMSLIAEHGLPKEFERFAVGEDEEQVRESLNSLQTLVNTAAEKMVAERLKGAGAPRSGVPAQGLTINDVIRGQYVSRKG